MKRSRSASNAPSTASAQPSRLASPQPTAPSSDSTRTNSQRGGTVKVSIRAIFITGPPDFDVGASRILLRRGDEAAQVPRRLGLVLALLLAARLVRRNDRDAEAEAGGGEDVAPVLDQLLVGLADVADVAVEIEQAERVHIA